MTAHPIPRVPLQGGSRPSPLAPVLVPARFRRAARAGALGLLAALVAPAPGTTQTSVGLSLAIGTTAPVHPLFVGATPGSYSVGMHSADVLSAAAVSTGVVTMGVAWAHPQPVASGWGHGPRRSWRHRSASRLTPSCWSAWKDPWFAHWPYCDSGGFAAWAWMPAVHPWGWTYAYPVPVGLIYQGHAHAYPRSPRVRHRSPMHGWAFAMSVSFGPPWAPPPLWYAGMVYAPVTTIHVVQRPLWTVQEPPARSGPRGAPTFGGAGWVTQPEYKEDPGAPPRTATPRGAASQGTTATETPTGTSTPASSVGVPTNVARGASSPATTPATTRAPEASRPSTVPARTPAPSTSPAPSARTRPQMAPGNVTSAPTDRAPAPAAREAAPTATSPRATAPRAPAAMPGRAPAPAPSASTPPPARSAPAAAPPSRSAAPPAPPPSTRPQAGNAGAPASRPATRGADPASAGPAAPTAPSARPGPARGASPAPSPSSGPAATAPRTPGTTTPTAAPRRR